MTQAPMMVSADILDRLARIEPGSPVAKLREQRSAATEHTQGSYEALFGDNPGTSVSKLERAVIALRVAVLHDETALAAHYTRLFLDAGGSDGILTGAIEPESDQDLLTLRLAAMLRHANLLVLRPSSATPADIAALQAAGLSDAEIVTVSQIIAFVSYQIRVYIGLKLLQGQDRDEPDSNYGPISARETGFTQEHLSWKPWIEPFAAADATDEQRAVLPGARLDSPYFRLLALDPMILGERTATDNGIFQTPDGLPRAERELSAAVVSRLNGCIYCASVHSRAASQFSGRTEDVQRVLDDGIEAELDDRWRAITDFAAALALTPSAAMQWHIEHLRELGVEDLAILDVVQASAFFGWANRLMLTLGEPVTPG